MATYKNGHKRQKNDKFLSYILIGFAVTFFVILISIVLYNSFNEDLDVSNMLDMKEEQYLIYFYSDTCSYCIEIKDEVAAFRESNNADIKLYYLNSGNLKDGEYQYLYDTYEVSGTPTLLTIVDGVVVSTTNGVTDAFDQINNGIYGYIN